MGPGIGIWRANKVTWFSIAFLIFDVGIVLVTNTYLIGALPFALTYGAWRRKERYWLISLVCAIMSLVVAGAASSGSI